MNLYNDASLVITPNGFKAGKLYAVKGADLGVTRATSATRVNANGLIETVASNVPRIDYSGGSCPSILIEPQRTNLLLRSQEFDNVFWTPNNVTVNANSVISPDGTQNAETITSSGTTSFLYTPTLSLTGAYTLSFFAKKATSNFCWVYLNGYDAIFNLNTGTFVSSVVAPESYSIIAYANGWYKISITKTSPILDALSGIGVASSTNFNGVVGTNIYVWGAQLEAGSYATSYIPTTSASVTRNEDVITLTPTTGLTEITETFSDDTTNVITTIPSTYTMSQGRIKNVVMK
jgi:hypothetical protein